MEGLIAMNLQLWRTLRRKKNLCKQINKLRIIKIKIEIVIISSR